MIDFPANPTTGQLFTSGGITWMWDGTKWTLSSTGGGGGGASISVGDTPPSNPSPGALWWDSVKGQMYLWFVDLNSSQWVPTTNQVGGGYLPLTGGVMAGPITLAADPVAAMQPVTQQYFNKYPMIGSNRIINGDMRIDQRGIASGGGGTLTGFTVDRWQFNGPSVHGTWTRSTSAAAGVLALGVPYALAFATSSAYSPAATEAFCFFQSIEADMISDLAWGTSGAQPVTLSFWAFSSLGGTLSGSLRNYPPIATRSYPFTYTLPAGVWTKVAITIPGDTGGTWVLQGNAAGLGVQFDLGSGSSVRGPAGSWAVGNMVGATGAVNTIGTLNATFYVSNVKLEIGNVATPFNRKTLQESMSDCQRYYWQPSGVLLCEMYNSIAGNVHNQIILPVCMRATPTATPSGMSYTNCSALVLTLQDGQLTRATMNVTAAGLAYCNFNANYSAEI
jgi:hypothetical protein